MGAAGIDWKETACARVLQGRFEVAEKISLLKKISKQFAKFGIVGVLAFFIDYGTMLALTEAFGVDYLVSTTAGFVVALVFNYFASMRFVFERRDGMSRKKEFAIFAVLSVIGLGFNDLLMFASVDLAGIDYRIAKIAVTAAVSVYNFVTRKMFLEEKHQPPLSTLE